MEENLLEEQTKPAVSLSSPSAPQNFQPSTAGKKNKIFFGAIIFIILISGVMFGFKVLPWPFFENKTDQSLKLKPGEFLINDFKSEESGASLQEQQVLFEGIYNNESQTLTVNKISEISSYVLLGDVEAWENIAPQLKDFLKFEIVLNEKAVYSTIFPLNRETIGSSITFKITLPFYKEFLLRVSNKEGKSLLSQEVKL